MLSYKYLRTFILCGIFVIFAAGCRTPVITFPSDDITIDAGDSISFISETYPNAIYKWTFDGGAKDVLGQNPTVQFNKAGVYLACLVVVFEDLDSGIASLTVTVNSPSHGEALVERTGQYTSYTTGDDGDERAGVTWPHPRFTDNSDGTVTDNLTGLMWLRYSNCMQPFYPGFDDDETAGDGQVTWQHALDFISGINAGTYSNCGGGYTDWRLPNMKELQSLIHYAYREPALPNTIGNGKWSSGNPFINVQMDYYWTATNHAVDMGCAWYIGISTGRVLCTVKHESNYVWPVRAGG
jgi:hypothetical protein